MEAVDKDKNGTISQEEFIDFVESTITYKSVGDAKSASAMQYIEPMVLGFISMVERRRKATIAMWQSRAANVDKISRWFFFWSFTLVLLVLMGLDVEELAKKQEEAA